MNWFSYLDYVTWLPLLLWFVLFYWFRLVAYPLYLKKQMKNGQKWAYIPEFATKDSSYIGRLRLRLFLWTFLTIAFSTGSVVWCFWKFTLFSPIYGLGSFALFIVVAMILYRFAMNKVCHLFQAAYFLEYRRTCYESDRKGNLRNETDLLNRTVWSFTRKLRNAEKHRRLRKYVNAMAACKKIPPDLYAESMNEF